MTIQVFGDRAHVTIRQSQYDNDPIKIDGVRLNDCIDSLIAIRDAIPEDCRGEATIEIDNGYDNYFFFEIKYERPATAKEIEENAKRLAASAAEQEALERAQFERLKARFEGKAVAS